MESNMPVKKSRLAAMLLSLVHPGAGELYSGHVQRFMVISIVMFCGVLAFSTGLLGRSFAAAVLVAFLLALARIGSPVGAVVLAARPTPAAFSAWCRWYSVLGLAIALQVALVFGLPEVQRLATFRFAAGSMEPTLLQGDHFVVDRHGFREGGASRGDLAVVVSPEDQSMLIVKRVVAIGGDTVELKNKQLYVNGEPVEEPWVVHRDPRIGGKEDMLARRDQFPLFTVPPDHVFVLGDNRDFSLDSRFIGPIAMSSVVARPLYIYWASDRSRIGRRMDPQ